MFNKIVMSSSKSKTIAFRVTEQDWTTLNDLAKRLKSIGQLNHENPHLLVKEYAFAMANIVLKMHGWTQTTEQDDAVFALARGMANTLNPEQQQNQG